jgi:hypothetical protein
VSSESDAQRSKGKLAVLVSWAILAWLLRETRGELVEAFLPSLVSAVNLTEVVSVAARHGLGIEEVRRVIAELPLTVVPFDDDQVYRERIGATSRGGRTTRRGTLTHWPSPRRAASIVAMSIVLLVIMASMARFAAARSGSVAASSSTEGRGF